MKVQTIHQKLRSFRDEGKSMFLTSSFQTHSIPLLHIVSKLEFKIPVYCLNTGFLFHETLEFRDELAERFDLDMRTIHSETPKLQQRNADGHFYFTSNPDYCCHLNKVQPTERLLLKYDVWVNGVRADQNANRKRLKEIQPVRSGAIRFHPMLQWTAKDIFAYIRENDLPRHPLDEKGYASIGCVPCTRKADLNDPRAARWFGLNKTECGLHTDLAENK